MTDQQHNLQTMHAMPTMQTMPTTMHGMQPMQTMDTMQTMRAVQTARELFLLLSGENVSGLRLARVRALAATLAFPATVIANARVVVNAQVVAPPRREKRFMVTADPWREPPTQRPKVNLPVSFWTLRRRRKAVLTRSKSGRRPTWSRLPSVCGDAGENW
jgi:hypothetical protein